MTEELKPCPFCGEKNNLWKYISPWSALIECGGCGIKLPGSEVRTAYNLENDPIPEILSDLATRQICAKDKCDNLIEMWWVRPTDSFRILGHIERWNTRTAGA